MARKWLGPESDQIVIHTDGMICSTAPELLDSEAFRRVLSLYLAYLRRRDSTILEAFKWYLSPEEEERRLAELLCALASTPLERVARTLDFAWGFLDPERRKALAEFVEKFYDFWRSFDRFMVLHGEPGPSSYDQRPYRSFNDTIVALADLIRSVYRDVCENITNRHPRIYRQVAAGCQVGLIALPRECFLPPGYREVLGSVPTIRQIWIAPPLIIDPPMNRREGQFLKVEENPLEGLSLSEEDWVCYPAQVGDIRVFVYFHQRFMGLGCSLANLFELATDEQIASGPDAVYVYGAPPEALRRYGDNQTVFYEDQVNRLLVAAVPGEDRFGYFGYLKKMILTLHNIVMMRRGRMPFHGAMTRVVLRDGSAANILIIGDTATGKSESLEAFRVLGTDNIRDLRIVADDMGSLEIVPDGTIRGYGTEVGAFIRLDDLQEGFAFGQMDRGIFMSPQRVNARAVVPVTTMEEVLYGYPVDIILYANNYEEVDGERPIVERFNSPEEAIAVFRAGAAMSKGTTASKGLTHSYFANIFGPPQYKEIHDKLAGKTFEAAFASGVFVGQVRTRLGIPGYETNGPREVAGALFQLISELKGKRI